MTRLFAYLLAVAAVFGAAATLGRAVGPLERGRDGGEPHGEMESSEPAAALPGLAVAVGGLRLVPERTVLRARRRETFAFRIVRGADAVRGFDVEHERRMHLIVVRRDLVGFQHLHPRMQPDGTWTTQLRLAEGGAYRVFADFAAGGRRATLGVDVFVRGRTEPALRAAEPHRVRVGPYAVALRPRRFQAGRPVTLSFEVTQAGRPARVGRYLGARGHLVLLRAGDLAYLHTHADDDALAFEATFPSAGSYRAFLQFRAGGRVRTAATTFEVRP